MLKVKWMVPRICPEAEWSEEGELSGLKIKVCREHSVRTTGKNYKKSFKYLQYPEYMQLSYEAKW